MAVDTSATLMEVQSASITRALLNISPYQRVDAPPQTPTRWLSLNE